MSKLPRREFLQASALGVAGLGLAACTQPEDPTLVVKPPVPGTKGWHEGEERWVSSVCGQCAAGCGIRARVVEARAVKIEGHPSFPLNQGSIGPKGQAGLQVLYHPDRIQGPLVRDGARGAGKWRRVSWSEAIETVAASLRKLREQGEARGLVLVDGEPRGLTHELWGRFMRAYGSPNHVGHRSASDAAKVQAMTAMQGVAELPAYDWSNTRYVLGFGASLFESWCQTIHLTRAASRLRSGVAGVRAKFVQISPRMSITAMKADEWVPLEPATYGALALGLAHVLVRDELYDQAFVREHCFGFEPWTDAEGRAHKGFRELVLEEYAPDKVAQVTGVPAATIERLAQEAAQLRPAIAMADGSAAAATNALGTAMAIHALNALLGNLERPGGLLVQRDAPLAPWAPVELDAPALAGGAAVRLDGAGTAASPLASSVVQALPSAIASGAPYAAQALFLYYSNPVFSKPDGTAWQAAIAKVPLVVSFSPLADESTQWADVVLPDHTYLERWDVVPPIPSVGFPVLGLRQPVVPPQHDTMQAAEVLLKLAKAVGGGVARAFPWEDYKGAVAERLAGLVGGEGAASLDELMSGLEEKGGFWQPGYAYEQWHSAFRTPSKKFEFYAQSVAAQLARVFPSEAGRAGELAARGVAASGDALMLPHFTPPRWAGDPADFPLKLVAYRGVAYAEGGMRHLPWLVELNRNVRNPWRQYVEIAPEHARTLGVRDEDEVWVESPAGKRRLRVRIDVGTRPGTVGVTLGHGQWPPEAGAAPAGTWSLLVNHSDPLGGVLAAQGTRVRVTRA